MAMQTKSGRSGAGDATKHWWTLRLTAVALIPLAVWFVVSLVALAGADYPTMIAWVSNPFVTVLMLTMIVALFYHLRLGLQDMVEDYVHARPAKVVLSAVLTYGCFLLAMAAIAAVLKIAIAS